MNLVLLFVHFLFNPHQLSCLKSPILIRYMKRTKIAVPSLVFALILLCRGCATQNAGNWATFSSMCDIFQRSRRLYWAETADCSWCWRLR